MLTASNVLVVRDARGQLLIGPPASFIGGQRIGFIRGRSEIEGHLVRAVDEPSEIDDMRNACGRWHIDDGAFWALHDRQVIEQVARACASGLLVAAYFEDNHLIQHMPAKSFAEYSTSREMAKKSTASSGQKPKPTVPEDTIDRFLEVFALMSEKGYIKGELAEHLKAHAEGKPLDILLSVLTSKKNLAKGGGKVLMRLIGGPFFMAATLIWTAVTDGGNIVNAVEQIVEACEITVEAAEPADLDKAAKLMAAGLMMLGVTVLQALIGKLKPDVSAVPAKGSGGVPSPSGSRPQQRRPAPRDQNDDPTRKPESSKSTTSDGSGQKKSPSSKISQARVRQQKMLEENEGYNISPSSWDKYPSVGRHGTFISDKKSISDAIGPVPAGAKKIEISKAQAAKIEHDMGLEPGSLKDGFKIRKVTDINSMAPRSPMEGNSLFQGPGNHLPGGAPEMVIDSIPTKDTKNVSTLLEIVVK